MFSARVPAAGTGSPSGTVGPDVPAPPTRGSARSTRAPAGARSSSSAPTRRPATAARKAPARRPPTRRPTKRRDTRWAWAGALLALGLAVTLLARDLLDLLPDELPLVPDKKAC